MLAAVRSIDMTVIRVFKENPDGSFCLEQISRAIDDSDYDSDTEITYKDHQEHYDFCYDLIESAFPQPWLPNTSGAQSQASLTEHDTDTGEVSTTTSLSENEEDKRSLISKSTNEMEVSLSDCETVHELSEYDFGTNSLIRDDDCYFYGGHCQKDLSRSARDEGKSDDNETEHSRSGAKVVDCTKKYDFDDYSSGNLSDDERDRTSEDTTSNQ